MTYSAGGLRHLDRRARDVDLAGERVWHLDQHLALPEMRVLGGLRDGLDRRRRDHDMAVFRLVGRAAALPTLLSGGEIIRERDLDHREPGIQEAAIDDLP